MADDWRTLVDPAHLAAWMDTQGLGEGAIEGARQLTGGTQNLLLRFTRAGRDYVLRRPPLHPGANGDESMRREARVLEALRGTDVPHPGLVAACGDASVLGAAFYLMEPVDGFSPTGDLPPAAHAPACQHRIGLEMARGIAALSRVDIAHPALQGLGKLDGYLERQVPRWRKLLQSYEEHAGWDGPAALPHVDALARWLDANLPPSIQPGLVHGDYHINNVMVDANGRLAAIVDWELATIGEPLVDLGWLVATWPTPEGEGLPRLRTRPWTSFATADEIVDEYAALTGRSLEHLRWYVVFACFKLGIILEGTHARACAGKADPREGDALHESAIWLLERARHQIDTGVTA
jgi:aminoglycoside phosphotransferase (APT) family kinase protein